MGEASKQYILITPVKNEEKFLPYLIRSITDQTIKPALWVIMDDGSFDHTPEIINEAAKNHNWIQGIRMSESIRDRGVHLAEVIKTGFDYAAEYCHTNDIYYVYLGNADADVVFDKTYFEILIDKFETNPKLGIASGGLSMLEDDKETLLENIYPDGGDILYRRKCFEECGGVPLFGLWDSALNAKARLKGWDVKRFNDCKAIVTRSYCNADNLWKQYIKIGENYYIMNYNPFHTFLKGIRICFQRPYYLVVPFFSSYLYNFIIRKKQIPDEEIRNYFWHMQYEETKRYYVDKLKAIFKI